MQRLQPELHQDLAPAVLDLEQGPQGLKEAL